MEEKHTVSAWSSLSLQWNIINDIWYGKNRRHHNSIDDHFGHTIPPPKRIYLKIVLFKYALTLDPSIESGTIYHHLTWFHRIWPIFHNISPTWIFFYKIFGKTHHFPYFSPPPPPTPPFFWAPKSGVEAPHTPLVLHLTAHLHLIKRSLGTKRWSNPGDSNHH